MEDGAVRFVGGETTDEVGLVRMHGVQPGGCNSRQLLSDPLQDVGKAFARIAPPLVASRHGAHACESRRDANGLRGAPRGLGGVSLTSLLGGRVLQPQVTPIP
jgi:hypothetical protein